MLPISRKRPKAAGDHMTVTDTIVAELVQNRSTPRRQALVQGAATP